MCIVQSIVMILLVYSVCVCVFLPIHSEHQVRWTYQPGSHRRKATGFLIHLLSAVRAFIFLTRRIQPSLSHVDCEVEFCVPLNNDLIVLHPLGIFVLFFSFLVRKIPFAGIELTSQRVKGYEVPLSYRGDRLYSTRRNSVPFFSISLIADEPFMVTHLTRVWINRVRLPILLVVS